MFYHNIYIKNKIYLQFKSVSAKPIVINIRSSKTGLRANIWTLFQNHNIIATMNGKNSVFIYNQILVKPPFWFMT